MFKKSSAALLYSLIAGVALTALVVPVATQTPSPATQRPRKVFPREQDPEDVVRFDTDVVSVEVIDVDHQGRPVKNLRPEDFKVQLDGVEQPISFFQLED